MVKACITQKCNYVDITGESYVSLVVFVYSRVHSFLFGRSVEQLREVYEQFLYC